MKHQVVAFTVGLIFFSPQAYSDEVCTWMARVIGAIPTQFKEYAYDCDDDFCETSLKPATATDCWSNHKYSRGIQYAYYNCDWKLWEDTLEEGRQRFLSFNSEVKSCLSQIMRLGDYPRIRQSDEKSLYDGVNRMSEEQTIQFSPEGFAVISMRVDIEPLQQGYKKSASEISFSVNAMDPWDYYIKDRH